MLPCRRCGAGKITRGRRGIGGGVERMIHTQRMKLLARVFRLDVSVCSRCGGPMRILRAVTEPDAIATEQHGARAPPRPSPLGQMRLFAPS
jgi:hypothetical protein